MGQVCRQHNSVEWIVLTAAPLVLLQNITVSHEYSINTNAFVYHLFLQFLSDCVWQTSVPTCFCTLHGRKPSPGTKPGERTHLMFRERSSALHALSTSHTGDVKSHVMFSLKHVWSKHTFWDPVQSKLGIPWVASSRSWKVRCFCWLGLFFFSTWIAYQTLFFAKCVTEMMGKATCADPKCDLNSERWRAHLAVWKGDDRKVAA